MNPIVLRYYQQEAIKAILNFFYRTAPYRGYKLLNQGIKMEKPKVAKTTTIRNLPPEWHEFKKIAMDEGISANEKLKRLIIETVENAD